MSVNEVVYRLKVDGSATADLTATAKAAEQAAQAERALVAATKAATDAQKQLATVPTAPQLSALGAAAEEGSVKVSKLGMAMGPLAGVIGRISPEAGAALSSVAGLTSTVQGLGAAGITSAAGLASMAAMLAPIALAVGALALAYKHYSDELAVAEARQQKMADAAERASKAHQELEGNVSDLAARYRDAVGGTVGKAQDQLEKDMTAAARSYEIRMSFARSIVGDYARAQAAASEAERKRKEEEAQAYAVYEKAIAQGDRRTNSVKAQTEAVQALTDAYQTLTNAAGTRFTFGAGGGETVQRGALTQAQIGQLASAGQDAAGLDTATMLSNAEVAARLESIDTIDKWNTSVEESTDRMSAVAKGAGMVGAVGGGPSSMLSAMGPWGALVDAIVKAVTHFADLGDTFTQYTAEFNDALAKLPETLMDNLPRWLQEGTRSTIAMLPKLISTLVIEFFNPENWIKAAEGFIQGLTDGLTEGFSDYKAPQQTGSFDLFGALGGSSGTSGGASKSPDLFVKASDFWQDFTKAVDKETSQIGRAFG